MWLLIIEFARRWASLFGRMHVKWVIIIINTCLHVILHIGIIPHDASPSKQPNAMQGESLRTITR